MVDLKEGCLVQHVTNTSITWLVQKVYPQNQANKTYVRCITVNRLGDVKTMEVISSELIVVS